MAMAGVNDSSLQVDSQVTCNGLVWGFTVIWHSCTFIKWMG